MLNKQKILGFFSSSDLSKSTLRRRNSLAFNITKFIKHDGDDFSELTRQIQAEMNALLENVQHNARDESKYSSGPAL
jgi:deoxycytidylate deaminase